MNAICKLWKGKGLSDAQTIISKALVTLLVLFWGDLASFAAVNGTVMFPLLGINCKC